MKKIMFFIVAVLVCACDSQEKIQSEVNAAFEQYETFAMECSREHAKEDANEKVKAITSHKSHPSQEKLTMAVENDANLIASKCFDKLFDKYGEVNVINAVKTFAAGKTYKEVDISSKTELYRKLRESILINYFNILASNLEIKKLNMELEMIGY